MKTMISRRSFLCAAGIASASAVLTACGGSSSSTASSTASSAAASSEAASGESVELIVFAAASLTETLNAIAETYSAENPGVTFSFNFDSSGTLKTQIQEGADCDLFISAGQKQMNQLDSTASAEVNTEGLDFVDAESRVDLLENKVVLCVPEGSDKGIDSFDSLAEHLKAEDILCLQMFGQCVKAVNALVAALRHAEHHLVFQQVHAAVDIHKVKAVLVHIGRSGDVQLVHLLLTGRDEQIAIRALLDLGLEGTGGVEVKAEGHLRVLCRVAFADGVQRFGEGGGGKHDQLHVLASLRGSGGRGSHRRCCAGSSTAAGGEGSGCTGHTGSCQKTPTGNAMVVHLCFSLL